jgi:hypothetical protein
MKQHDETQGRRKMEKGEEGEGKRKKTTEQNNKDMK